MQSSGLYEITIKPDGRWPICPINGAVLEGRIQNGRRFIGWFTEDEFQFWLEKRDGFIAKSDGDVRIAVVRLTAAERKASR
jgi:hypothetical protein